MAVLKKRVFAVIGLLMAMPVFAEAPVAGVNDSMKGDVDELRNVMIQVRSNSSEQGSVQQQGISGGIVRDRIYVGTGKPLQVQKDGAIISADGLGYSTHHSTTRSVSTSEQQLRTVEGHSAFLYTGQVIRLPGVDAGGYPYTVEADALRGVYVTPHFVGNRVRLQISTRDDAFNTELIKGAVAIDTERLSTTVSGRIGEWIDLGGVTLDEHTRADGTVKKTTESLQRVGNISVRVVPLD